MDTVRTEDGNGEVRFAQADKIEALLGEMPDEEMVHLLAETFRALADPTRVKIISALSRRELCVHDLASILGLTGSAVSHQLRLLRGQRLVRYRKVGKMAYYRLDDEHISRLFAEGVKHVEAG